MSVREHEEFILLSEIAVTEQDREEFIRVLKKRNTYINRLLKEDPETLREDLEECLSREKAIVQRLERERGKIIEQMDKVSKSRKAVAGYRARYPFPFMPRFLDIDG